MIRAQSASDKIAVLDMTGSSRRDTLAYGRHALVQPSMRDAGHRGDVLGGTSEELLLALCLCRAARGARMAGWDTTAASTLEAEASSKPRERKMRQLRRWCCVRPLLIGGALDRNWARRNSLKMVGVSVPGDGKAGHLEYKCLACGFQTPALRPPKHCGRTMKLVKA